MVRSIRFSKLSGSGNDFVCIDNRDGSLDDLLAQPRRIGHFARALCRRGLGIGADGVVFACAPEIEGVADVAARFLEPDGSEASLCGNGTACFIRWLDTEHITPGGEVRILSPAGIVRGQDLQDGFVRVCLPLPEDMQTDLKLQVDSAIVSCDYVVTGIEHVVTFVDNIDCADVSRLGAAIRNHPYFPQPRGVNVNFAQVLAEGRIAIRTYEYGVEAETLACGTGSAAAAILATRRFGWPREYTTGQKAVEVQSPGGDILRVYFVVEDDGSVRDPCLETRVRCTYTGSLCPDLASLALGETDDDPPAEANGEASQTPLSRTDAS
jgi:diaminopimelate epimerase